MQELVLEIPYWIRLVVFVVFLSTVYVMAMAISLRIIRNENFWTETRDQLKNKIYKKEGGQ